MPDEPRGWMRRAWESCVRRSVIAALVGLAQARAAGRRRRTPADQRRGRADQLLVADERRAVRIGEPFSRRAHLRGGRDRDDDGRARPVAARSGGAAAAAVRGARRIARPDLRSDSRRFFQYQYSLRLINEDMFGNDAHLPSVEINYRIESRVGRGEAVRGRDRTYILPPDRSACCRSCRSTPPTSATRRPGPSATSRRGVSAPACSSSPPPAVRAAALVIASRSCG